MEQELHKLIVDMVLQYRIQKYQTTLLRQLVPQH